MGRYYSGDIDGKFWFAVQDSTSPERFGAVENQSHISYEIPKDDFIYDQLIKIEDDMGDYLEVYEDFFNQDRGYNDEELSDYAKVRGLSGNLDVIKEMLTDYADWLLGMQILDFFDDNPSESYLHMEAEI